MNMWMRIDLRWVAFSFLYYIPCWLISEHGWNLRLVAGAMLFIILASIQTSLGDAR